MFEEDYIMRTIKEMVRALLKFLFGVDTDAPTEALLEEKQSRAVWEELKKSIDDGNINEAENALYSFIDAGDKEALKTALLFYSYVNEKEEGHPFIYISDRFLAILGWTREEIKTGLQDVAARYGLDSLADIF